MAQPSPPAFTCSLGFLSFTQPSPAEGQKRQQWQRRKTQMLTEYRRRGDCLAQGTERVDIRLSYLIATHLIVRPNLLVRLANGSWWAKW